jgi:thiol-disulfide isomerase/thioredoxin
LDLMAVRCPPCETQMPELQKLKIQLGNNVIILSINVDGAGGHESVQDVRDKYEQYIKEE